MSKNILITGGAGFIGSNLCSKLFDEGYNVTIIDNLSQQIHGPNPEKTSFTYKSIIGKSCFILGDIRSREDWKKALENIEVIVHLAAETGTGQSMYDISRYVETNVGGTAILLDILANERHSVKKIVVASSRAVYGEGKYYCEDHGNVYPSARKEEDMIKGDFSCKCPSCGKNVESIPTDEDSKLHPTSIYGITKLNQEQMVLTIGKALGISTIALRYQNVYGPGQSLSNPYTGILSIFSNLIIEGSPINIFEDGKESRDFVYIDDVIEATFLAIEQPQKIFDVFNVGSGEKTTVLDVVNGLYENYNREPNYSIKGNFRIGDIAHNYSDNQYIRDVLGFESKANFKNGIRNFIDWVKVQNISSSSSYNSSINEMIDKGLFK